MERPLRHARTSEVPAEALLADDYELALVWAPLHEPGTSCQYGACHSEEECTCNDDAQQRLAEA